MHVNFLETNKYRLVKNKLFFKVTFALIILQDRYKVGLEKG